MTIDTKRLTLRPFQMSDLNDFYTYAKVEGVGEMAGWPHHRSINESKTILKSFIANGDVLAIVHKQTDNVIGSIGFHKKPFDDDDSQYQQREIGYVLSKDYWSQGYMQEAVSALIEYLFNDLSIDRLTCAHFTHNHASKRIIEKMGFTFVKDDIYVSQSLNKTFKEKKYVLYKRDYDDQKRDNT